MVNRRAFKSDVSFLEKISMGAVGTHRVFEHLRNQGHNPLELERGSRSFKIWKNIKIKRIRVPDILCVACGRRVESRAKTTLEISMSHSLSDPERGWDYGLNDSDFVALVICKRVSDRPIDWQADELVQYISVHDLRSAQRNNLIVLVKPKGAEEGFEARISWPAAVAKSAGIIESVNNDCIKYRRQTDNRMITLSLFKQGLSLNPLVREGDAISENQVLAAVIPVVKQFPCSGGIAQDYYIAQLSSSSLTERYTAAKALSIFPSTEVSRVLTGKINESSEHIYVRLEAAASLARHDEEQGWLFIKQCLVDDYLQNRLEAVIALGEIPADASCQLLCSVLMDNQQHPEIRAGAAWALGELHSSLALNALVDSFSAVDEGIRIEAARALAKLASHFTTEIVDKFPQTAPDKRPGIAWALSKSGKFKLEELLNALVDEDARHWVSYILGTQDHQKYIDQIEKLRERDPEVYFAVTVLWKIMMSWVYNLEEY
ncbi:MAG: HEAT repeat domain-containing protein [Bacillota bacterium]